MNICGGQAEVLCGNEDCKAQNGKLHNTVLDNRQFT